MSRGLPIFVVTAASACLLGACNHLYGGADVASRHGGGPGLGALGDDLPAGMAEVAAAPAVGRASVAPTEDRVEAARAAKVVSIDMAVASLCARPAARAVVDRDLPGLTARPEYMFFKHMSLRQLQAASGGKMTSAELEQVSEDLGALPVEATPRTKPRRRTLLVRIASILP